MIRSESQNLGMEGSSYGTVSPTICELTTNYQFGLLVFLSSWFGLRFGGSWLGCSRLELTTRTDKFELGIHIHIHNTKPYFL